MSRERNSKYFGFQESQFPTEKHSRDQRQRIENSSSVSREGQGSHSERDYYSTSHHPNDVYQGRPYSYQANYNNDSYQSSRPVSRENRDAYSQRNYTSTPYYPYDDYQRQPYLGHYNNNSSQFSDPVSRENRDVYSRSNYTSTPYYLNDDYQRHPHLGHYNNNSSQFSDPVSRENRDSYSGRSYHSTSYYLNDDYQRQPYPGNYNNNSSQFSHPVSREDRDSHSSKNHNSSSYHQYKEQDIEKRKGIHKKSKKRKPRYQDPVSTSSSSDTSPNPNTLHQYKERDAEKRKNTIKTGKRKKYQYEDSISSSSSSSDALPTPMETQTIPLDIKISEFPGQEERQKFSGDEIILGDLHGNFLTVIQTLLRLEIISMGKTAYKELYRCFKMLEFEVNENLEAEGKKIEDAIQAAQNIQEEIFPKIKKGHHEKEIRIQFIGDILADRRSYDPVFISLLKKLQELGISYSITLSNHDIQLLGVILSHEKEGLEETYKKVCRINVEQSISLARLACLYKYDPQTGAQILNELKADLDDYYFPYLSLIDYTYQEGLLSLRTHAAVGLKEIETLARILLITAPTDLMDNHQNVTDIIDEINDKITHILRNRCWNKVLNSMGPSNTQMQMDVHPLLQFLWGRIEHEALDALTTLNDGTRIIYYHGHTGNYAKTEYYCNLNQLAGKNSFQDDRVQTVNIGFANKVGVFYENKNPLRIENVVNNSASSKYLFPVDHDYILENQEEVSDKEQKKEDPSEKQMNLEKQAGKEELTKKLLDMKTQLESIQKTIKNEEQKNTHFRDNALEGREAERSVSPEVIRFTNDTPNEQEFSQQYPNPVWQNNTNTPLPNNEMDYPYYYPYEQTFAVPSAPYIGDAPVNLPEPSSYSFFNSRENIGDATSDFAMDEHLKEISTCRENFVSQLQKYLEEKGPNDDKKKGGIIGSLFGPSTNVSNKREIITELFEDPLMFNEIQNIEQAQQVLDAMFTAKEKHNTTEKNKRSDLNIIFNDGCDALQNLLKSSVIPRQ